LLHRNICLAICVADHSPSFNVEVRNTQSFISRPAICLSLIYLTAANALETFLCVCESERYIYWTTVVLLFFDIIAFY
jgi:hypothetical protein